MKAQRVVPIALFVIALSPSFVSAEGRTPKEALHAVSIEVVVPIGVPVSLLVGERSVLIPLQIQYQRVVADHLVLLIKAGLNFDWTLPPKEPRRTLNIYPSVELDLHPFATGLKGLYLGVSGIFDCSFDFYGAAETGTTCFSYRFGVGPTLGRQFLLPADLILDAAFGLGFGPAVDVDEHGVRTSEFRWDPTRAGIFFGIRF